MDPGRNEVIKNIKNGLNQYYALSQFLGIKVDLSKYKNPKSEYLFDQVIIWKAITQSLLNLYYNSHYYSKCTLHPVIANSEELLSNKEYADILKQNEKPTENIVIDAIIRYVTLQKQLYVVEKHSFEDLEVDYEKQSQPSLSASNNKKTLPQEKAEERNSIMCIYCDNENSLISKKCGVCEADLCEGGKSYEYLPKNMVQSGERCDSKNIIVNKECVSREDEDKDNVSKEILRSVTNDEIAYRGRDIRVSGGITNDVTDVNRNDSKNSINSKICLSNEIPRSVVKVDSYESEERSDARKSKEESNFSRGESLQDNHRYRGATGGGNVGDRNIDARDESMSEMASLGNTWKCTHCTFINKGNNDICDTCFGGREISGDGDNMGDYDKKYHSQNEAIFDSKGIKEEGPNYKSLRPAMAPMYPRGNNNESEVMSEDLNKQKKRKTRNNNKGRRSDQSSSNNKYELLQGVDNECITEEYRPSKNASFNDVFGGSLGDGGWHCKRCTMINKSKFHKCQTCGYDRCDLGGHEARNNDDDRTNKDHVVVDKYIGATASTSVTVTPRDITWSCPSCTYNNKSKDKKCHLCKCGRSDQVSQMTDDGPQKRDKIENYKVDKSKKDDNLVQSASKDKYIGATASISVTAVAQVDTWSCPSCSYNNKSDNICCEVCFSQRQRQSSITVTDDNIDDNIDNIDDDEVETPEEKWTCKKCRCNYLYDKYICDKCHNYAPFFEKWVCERCRLFNEPLSNNCNACGAKNNHLGKCTKCKFNIVNVDINNICDDCNEDCKDKTVLDTEVWVDVISKKCIKCKNKIDSKGPICKKCTAAMYYCNNRWCGSINSNKEKYCHKCKLKKDVNVTDYNLVEVQNGKSELKMWQCTFCGLFNSMGKISKCTSCKNMRHTSSYKKCSCNWINKDNASKCDKCFKILPKRT